MTKRERWKRMDNFKTFIEYTPEIYTVRITPTFIDLVLTSDELNTIYSYF